MQKLLKVVQKWLRITKHIAKKQEEENNLYCETKFLKMQ